MVEQIVSYKDFPKICRFCFNKDNLKSIFELPEFLRDLHTLTKIKVSSFDKLPKHACTNCIEKFNYTNSFLEFCRNSDNILKTIVIQHEDTSALQQIQTKFNPENSKIENVEEIHVKHEDSEEDLTIGIANNGNQTKPSIAKENDKDTRETLFACTKCDEKFLDLISQRRHAKSHKQVEKRNDQCKCISCNKSFTRRSDLRRHLRVHTGIKLFTCIPCNKKFTQKNSLDRHNLLHTGKFSCMVCNKSFTRKKYLESHLKIHDTKSAKATNKNSSDNFRCDICDKLFTTKANLEQHYLSHTEIKEFKCDKCQAAFNRRILLEKHKNVHDVTSEEKQRLTCNDCGKYFLFPSHLKRHAAVHNPNQTSENCRPRIHPKKPGGYLCSYCGKKFTQTSNLNVHIRKHTGERFNCNICGNTYSTKNSLKTHLMAHKGEKPYPCPHCGKQFRKPSLYRHILIHKDIRKHKCKMCAKTFIRKDQLDQHLRIHK